MKLLSYSVDGQKKLGILSDDHKKIVDIASVGLRADTMPELIQLLASTAGESLLKQAADAPGISISACTVLSPIKYPAQDIICLGVNYYEHRDETIASDIQYSTQNTKPVYFSKRVNETVDPDDYIDSHADLVKGLDYEVELAVILGKDAYQVPLEQAQDYVFGYTILNDVSARDLQSSHQQWYFGKSLDRFTPLGPWIVTKDEFSWPPALDLRCYVNGDLRQHNNTKCMITGIDQAIHQLSSGMTLKAGTILAMGTPSGVGMAFDPPRYLKTGDVVRCEIDGIGYLENVVR
jgi:2-keto-4-pentenoate hydratase/2-oxohepta-3-ene-1,7-dioic acid hydratase in catechol pathway